MKYKLILLLFLSVFFISCNNKDSQSEKETQNLLKAGRWRASLQIDATQAELEIPFIINFINDSGIYRAEIINADERIQISEISLHNDSVFIMLPVFDSEIKARIHNDSLVGKWFNYVKGDYFMPFNACFDDSIRFHPKDNNANLGDVNGRWFAEFSPAKEGSSNAIGEFTQNGSKVIGTFITETGDYRFLEGIVDGQQLLLSCFDGSHAFLFTSDIVGDSLINGMFYSGKHWKEEWRAAKNDSLFLKDPYTLTFLKDGYSKFEFEMPDINGNLVSLTDERFKDKVVIVQIMGSWCPNCVDETFLLEELHKEYSDKGLEIMALAFERFEDTATIKRNIKRLKEYTGAEYDFLMAGKVGKESIAAKLPMLNHIMSYPTTIIIDKNGDVRKIYTGFSGPGTGKHYEIFVSELKLLIENMLRE
ncbi:TlpA disulfide reductase family protein [Bacteroidota bacterium]